MAKISLKESMKQFLKKNLNIFDYQALKDILEESMRNMINFGAINEPVFPMTMMEILKQSM